MNLSPDHLSAAAEFVDAVHPSGMMAHNIVSIATSVIAWHSAFATAAVCSHKLLTATGGVGCPRAVKYSSSTSVRIVFRFRLASTSTPCTIASA